MSLLARDFAEKIVREYIDDGLWRKCNLSDHYVYLEYLDEGGYGCVHKVMDRKTGSYLIMKRSSKKNFVEGTLPPSTRRVEQHGDATLVVDRELHVSKEVEFMEIVHRELGGLKLYDYYDDIDHYIMVMEDGGRSLESLAYSHKKKIRDLVRRDQCKTNFFYRVHLKNIRDILVRVYHKIEAIHRLGIHHNDLKPANIVIRGTEVAVIDYGVAEHVESSYSRYKGTLEYVPYEYVADGSYKPWDHTVWCFGVMLHFLTLAKHPFLKEEDVLRHELDDAELDKLPPLFSNLVRECLRCNPLQRPKNLLERLEGLS
jgi:serine/threonine protein kinase